MGSIRKFKTVYCKKCRKEMWEIITLRVRMPIGMNTIAKRALHDPRVEILGADRVPKQMGCGCVVKDPQRPKPPPVGPAH